ncbi:MAG: hypothetical protein WAT77_13175, partial [Paracoccaceae bacterium]
MYNLAGGSLASLMGVVGYSSFIGQNSTPHFSVIDVPTGIGGTLVATGLSPSGWASYQLNGNGSFGAALQTPLAFDPTASASYQTGGSTFVYLAPDGNGRPLAFALSGTGALTPIASQPNAASLPSVSDMAVAQTSAGSFLLAASAAGNSVTSYSIGPNGAITLANQVTDAVGVGMSKPTAVEVLTVGGVTYAVVAGAESSSLSVFRVLPDGRLYPVDHIVDSLTTHFAGATALTSLQIGDRGYVVVGGSDDGFDVLTLLPDGRLIHLMT